MERTPENDMNEHQIRAHLCKVCPISGAHRYLCNHVQRFLQAGAHCIGRGELGIVIQMRVNIGRGGKVAVPEPFLNLLHGYAVGEKKRGAAMTQIMKANPAKPMTFENPWEDLREIIGLDQIAELINADIFAVFFVVALAAQPSTVLLIFSLTQKPFFEDWDKRKRPHGSTGFKNKLRVFVLKRGSFFELSEHGRANFFHAPHIIRAIKR